VQKLKTPAGIEVWLVEDKTVPVISVTFSFDGGLIYDPKDKPGVGRLVSILLDEGADQMTSQEFQSQLSNNAIQMSFSSGRDAFQGQLKTLKSNQALAFDLLRLALNKPRFDADAIERMRNANTSQIKDDMGDPSWLVARTFNGMVFEGHAYALPGFGNLDSMQRIARKDLLKFVSAQFARNVLKVSIAGDITREEATKAVDDVFGALPDKAEKADGVEAPLNYAGKTILLPLDAPQTYIIAGEAGIKRDNKDWHAAVIMNYILGGSDFDARLMKEIREKRGLTYGIYSDLNSMNHAALLQANMSASNEKVAEALKLLKQEWAKMAKEGPTDQEIQDAKSYLTGSLLLELTSTDDISEALNGFQRDGLDFDYINQRNAAINAVAISDIKRIAARLLKPENLTVVLVGQPANVTADIMLDHAPGVTVPQQKQ
jgi:zinc protease